MTSRDAILKSLQHAHMPHVPAPDIPSFGRPEGPMIERFAVAVENVAGHVVTVGQPIGERSQPEPFTSVQEALDASFGDVQTIAAGQSGWMERAVVVHAGLDPRMMTNIDVFVCRAEVGIAENGAVWISEVGRAVALFGARHLAVVLHRDDIIWNMHEAYERIDLRRVDYGVFVSGPSKTADIEQSLVIGAHGPAALTIFLI